MKIAALDFGTNSFLCLIAEVSHSGQFQVLHDESQIVRLGQDLQKTGRLHPEALMRAENTLKSFRDTISKFQVDRVQAVATAAAREAENSSAFLQLCQQYQFPLRTISGEEEARMSFRGAISAEASEKTLLIDIGGGSTEYIVGTPKKIEFAQSLPYGAVKLTEKYISQQPVQLEDEQALRKFIKSRTEEVWAQVESLNPTKIIAVAGTPTAIVAAIQGQFDAKKVEGFQLSQGLLTEWVEKFRKTSIEEKKSRYSLGGRADVIFAGTIILDELLKRLDQDALYVSTKGIRYGLAYQMLDDLRDRP